MITHNVGAQNDDKQPKKGFMNMADTSSPDKKSDERKSGSGGNDGRKMSHSSKK